MITAMPSANTAQLLFCWLRETAPGHLECDLGLPLERADLPLAMLGLHPSQQRAATTDALTLDQVARALSSKACFRALPEWARKRLSVMFGPVSSDEQAPAVQRHLEHVVAAAEHALAVAPLNARVEVHMPYFSRRAWPDRFDILQRESFSLRDGRVLPSSTTDNSAELNSYNARLLAAGAMRADATIELRHSFGCAIPAAAAATLLAAAFGSDAPSGSQWGEVTVSETLRNSALSAWRRAPIEKSPAYFPAHAAVSVALQHAFRRWLAWLWLSDPARWENVDGTQAVLAYAASRPFPGRRRTDFTWDVLSPDWVYGAFRSSRRALTMKLRSVRQAMLCAGRRDLAEQYKPSLSKAILTRVRKQKKTVRNLFACEGEVVDHVLQFGLILRNAEDEFQLGHQAADFADGLATRLRRMSTEMDLTPLATMVMLQASNALHTALGGENQLLTRTCFTSPEPLESLAA
jgi:hypothetical protein